MIDGNIDIDRRHPFVINFPIARRARFAHCPCRLHLVKEAMKLSKTNGRYRREPCSHLGKRRAASQEMMHIQCVENKVMEGVNVGVWTALCAVSLLVNFVVHVLVDVVPFALHL